MLLSLDIDRIETLADGAPFGEVGAYERVIGRAKGEVDPLDPANKGIALIDKAPRNGRGKVEYATDIFILRPKDFSRGNGRILYEVNNRGRKMLFGNIADGPQGVNDPKTVADVLREMRAAGKGIVGMKILGQGDLRTRQDETLKYALSLGVLDAFTIGAESKAEQQDLIRRIEMAA